MGGDDFGEVLSCAVSLLMIDISAVLSRNVARWDSCVLCLAAETRTGRQIGRDQWGEKNSTVAC